MDYDGHKMQSEKDLWVRIITLKIVFSGTWFPFIFYVLGPFVKCVMENLTFNQKKKIKNFEKYIQGIEIFLIEKIKVYNDIAFI
jgi:hypothetical protein